MWTVSDGLQSCSLQRGGLLRKWRKYGFRIKSRCSLTCMLSKKESILKTDWILPQEYATEPTDSYSMENGMGKSS